MRTIEPVQHRTAALALLTLLAAASLSIGLAHVWMVGYGGRNHVFAGLFALSDAGEYYWDAERVLHGAAMNTGGARRPIFSAVLAGVLRVVGHDIHLAHVVTMVVWSGSGAFAVREVWRTHGHRVATVVFVMFVLFARRYVGFVQSEGMGVPLGALAFGLLWRAHSMKTPWHATFLGALLLQSVALLARPGPMFVIPAMLFWGVRRAPKGERLKLFLHGAGIVAVALALQYTVRITTTHQASFSDLPPILYGLIHGEDSQFVLAHHPWLRDLNDGVRTEAIWTLLRNDLLERPALVLLAPFRCLAAWFYLPQGFFGVVWLNPDDRALEDARAVKQAIVDHGYVGPVILWVRQLGAYSLINAIAMAVGGIAFVFGLLRAPFRAFRARHSNNSPFLVPIALGILASLPLLPPWITEGAQILASVFFYVVTFAVTSFLPPRRVQPDASVLRGAPRLGPAVVVALVALVSLVKVFPVRPPTNACHDDGRYLADVDRFGTVTYGAESSRPTLADARANVGMLEKNNPAFARAISETLATPHRIFPAYDACRDRMLYVVADPDPTSVGEVAYARTRWVWLRTSPMAQSPLERLERKSSP